MGTEEKKMEEILRGVRWMYFRLSAVDQKLIQSCEVL